MTIDEINIIRLALDTHRYEVDCEKNITDAKRILNKQEKAINYTRCCESDSELLPDVEKKQLIEDAYWLNLQNLNGREDFEEAFKLGIETGVDETLEKLQS